MPEAFSTGGEEVKEEDISKLTPAEIDVRITEISEESRYLLDELKRQNEYDLSRGVTPGKFREILIVSTIGEQRNTSLQSLK